MYIRICVLVHIGKCDWCHTFMIIITIIIILMITSVGDLTKILLGSKHCLFDYILQEDEEESTVKDLSATPTVQICDLNGLQIGCYVIYSAKRFFYQNIRAVQCNPMMFF